VVYNPKYNVDYDGSMVPAEWFGWLHYKTDKTPLEKVRSSALRNSVPVSASYFFKSRATNGSTKLHTTDTFI